MYNSEQILKSSVLAAEYGEPFEKEVQLYPPSEEHRVTGETVRQKMVKDRGLFSCIQDRIRASGNGDGSREGNTVKSFVTGPSAKVNGKMIAHGDATGYRYLRFKEEDEFDDYVSVSPNSVAATMTNIPRIEAVSATSASASSKRGKTPATNSANKKNKSSGFESTETVVINLLERMNRNQSTSELRDEIANLRHQISTDETLLLNHRSQISGFSAEYFKWKKMVMGGEITKEDNAEEYEYYEFTNFNFRNCQTKITELDEKIDNMKGELKLNMKIMLDAKKDVESKEAESKKTADKTADVDVEQDDKDDEDEDKSIKSIGSLNGSVDLDDSEIPKFDEVC